ncbi:hypothetical protein V9T40_004002 [Parthenolecanium corni]|uniref:Uncharacterized protein n=1 Tax=Parthenolecanium corni TaxID=536013 RepID=A0AAN9TI67_9HEMI
MAEEPHRKLSLSTNPEELAKLAEEDSGSSDPNTADKPADELAENADKTEPPIEDEPIGEELLETEPVVPKKEPVPEKSKSRANLVLEYDLIDMYPEMSLLIQTTKKDWNCHDPEVIRAMWLESKTNALRAWKYKNTKILKRKKPDLTMQMNHTVQLRQEYRERMKERNKEEERRLAMLHVGREAPDFQEIKLPTNLTAELRYKFNRDNPPVPRYYLHHFERYKKPPFKLKTSSGTGCQPNALQSA